VAIIVDLDLDRASGRIKVPRAFVAVDSGQIINPDGLTNQIEGGVVQSTSWRCTSRCGSIRRASCPDWDSYPILTMSDAPSVTTVLIDRPTERSLGPERRRKVRPRPPSPTRSRPPPASASASCRCFPTGSRQRWRKGATFDQGRQSVKESRWLAQERQQGEPVHDGELFSACHHRFGGGSSDSVGADREPGDGADPQGGAEK